MRVTITDGDTFRDVLHVGVDSEGTATLRFKNRKKTVDAPAGFEVQA